jgi:hypothetical protein
MVNPRMAYIMWNEVQKIVLILNDRLKITKAVRLGQSTDYNESHFLYTLT